MMAGGVFSGAKLHAMTIRESANDGSDFTNPDADYRRLFLGEDGLLYVKDSSGTVTNPFTGGGSVATDAIWDAAGDLAVGTGANTAAKLTIGSPGQIAHVASGTVAWGHPSGSIVQIVRATSTSSNTTTSATYQDSDLDVAITPKYSNSIILIDAHFWCEAYRVAGSPLSRQMNVRIRNSTDNSNGGSHLLGPDLEGGASSAQATQRFGATTIHWEYTVNSTSARTFLLQYNSPESTNVEAAVRGDASTAYIIATEVRA